MENPIIEFISKYVVLTEEEKQVILNQSLIRNVKKGEHLLSEGDMTNECFFILKGCAFSYYLVDGDIKVTEFHTEAKPIKPMCTITQRPSEYYIECLEDSIISFGSPGRTEDLLKKLPRLAAFTSPVLEDQIADKQIVRDNFIKLSPEKRYQHLQKTSPELLNRVPQYLIASYLGIKPETLSRIRKRIYA
jgi:CRP-like cAMP-binding protein